MKRTIKSLFSILMIAAIILSVFAFNVSAASATITGAGEYEIGESFSVKVNFNADATLYAVEVDVNYNSSVLRLNSVSGADYNAGNGTVKIVDDGFSATKPSKTSSYTLNFTAIAAGNSKVTAIILGGGEAESRANTSANITVVAPKPSANANLASIRLSNGSLSPAFNPNTTEYTATVRYEVASVSITGAVADGKSTYSGGGTFELAVGDNERVLTVTAQDGTKKSYTINIKRMSEQETLDADQAARDANPTLVVIDGQDYTIVNDLSNARIPAGFTVGTATRKEAEIAVVNDDHGEYTLYWLVDAAGENGAFYTRNEADQFTRLNYINTNGKMYIIERPDLEGYLPQKYTRSTRAIDGVEVMVYNYVDVAFEEFCIVKCYVDGARAYYQFDTAEGSLQRAIAFDMDVKQENSDIDTNEKTEEKNNNFVWFSAMSKTGKTVFFIFVGVMVLVIVVAILLIAKISASKYANVDEEYAAAGNDDFIINDFEYTEDAQENDDGDTSLMQDFVVGESDSEQE
ncbi:MAG: cadherin-like beta sandwich domain-containing protein [Clostridia bacterium]|nr:cadherin-like beta sandwich domain-containing protein [Clostridia bacterium]